MAKLVLHVPDGTLREIRLDRDRLTIGRRPDNDLWLPFPAVSADHAEIITIGTDSFIHDLNSTNGTLINGKRIARHLLVDQDRIDIGRQQLVYLTNESATVEALPPEAVSEEMRGLIERLRARSAPKRQRQRSQRRTVPDPSLYRGIDPEDELLTDLMETPSSASVAVDMPPTMSVVRAAAKRTIAA